MDMKPGASSGLLPRLRERGEDPAMFFTGFTRGRLEFNELRGWTERRSADRRQHAESRFTRYGVAMENDVARSKPAWLS
jgi:hypothetical protein